MLLSIVTLVLLVGEVFIYIKYFGTIACLIISTPWVNKRIISQIWKLLKYFWKTVPTSGGRKRTTQGSASSALSRRTDMPSFLLIYSEFERVLIFDCIFISWKTWAICRFFSPTATIRKIRFEIQHVRKVRGKMRACPRIISLRTESLEMFGVSYVSSCISISWLV